MFLFQGSLQSTQGLSYISLPVFHVSNGRAGRFLTARAGVRWLYRVKVWYPAPPVWGARAACTIRGPVLARCRPPPICSVQARILHSPASGLPLPGKSRIVAIAPITLCCIGGPWVVNSRPRPLSPSLSLAHAHSRALANYYPKRPPALLVVFDHSSANWPRPGLGGTVATTSSSPRAQSPTRGTTRLVLGRRRSLPLPWRQRRRRLLSAGLPKGSDPFPTI